jgi:NAD(P)-dependent dehydrogenase (short-subunit alcohol dehydrogenase family)
MQLTDKVAVVTGGGRGIGRAIALALAREGADVVVAGEAMPPLEEAAREIKTAGRRGLAILMDLLDQESPRRMVERALEEFGRIDILVNNAGAEGPIRNVAEMDLPGWNELLAVNLTGAMLCSRYVLERSMIPRQSGAIVNLSSAAGRKGLPTRSAYSSSKFGIIGLTQSLASEVGRHGIRVNAIAPGSVAGERIERIFRTYATNQGVAYEQIVAASNARAALGRMVTPEEVAAVVVFLVSEQSSGITGQTINVDAGTNYG